MMVTIAWPPGIVLNPHEHAMFAVVGMYGGQEDNTFFRRSEQGLEATGGRELAGGDVLVMGHGGRSHALKAMTAAIRKTQKADSRFIDITQDT